MTPDHEAAAREIVKNCNARYPNKTTLIAAIAEALAQAESEAEKRSLVKAREEIGALIKPVGEGAHATIYKTTFDIVLAILDRHIAAAGEPAIQSETRKNTESELNNIREYAEYLKSALYEIGEFADERSSGPGKPDYLWEIREMAYKRLPSFAAAEEPEDGDPPASREQLAQALTGEEARAGQAGEEYDALRERVAVLEKALRPFDNQDTDPLEGDDTERCLVVATLADVRRSRAALSGAAAERDGWRPIAEAPKDGTSILAWIASDQPEDRRAEVAFWRSDFQAWVVAESWSIVQPTHYRSLPAPPSPALAASGKGERS